MEYETSSAAGNPASYSFYLDLAAPHSECDVERHRPTLQQDRERIALFHVAGEPLEVGHGSNGLAVKLLDDIAPLHAGLGRRGAVFDAHHDHAFGRSQVELAGDIGRDRADLKP